MKLFNPNHINELGGQRGEYVIRKEFSILLLDIKDTSDYAKLLCRNANVIRKPFSILLLDI